MDYLAINQYGNTVTEDLWDVLDLHAEDIPDDLYIQEIMDTWTKAPGYPVVFSDGSTVSQERFFLNVTASESLAEQSNWIIPISISYPEKLEPNENKVATTFWLRNRSASLNVESRPYLLNFEASGFYRVAY